MGTRLHEVVCILCPIGCKMIVETKDGEVVKVEDDGCKRGREYGVQEITSPVRDFFTTLRVEDGRIPVLSVRSTGSVPKEMLMECAKELAKIRVSAPVKAGELIVKNIMNLGVDIVATKDVDKA